MEGGSGTEVQMELGGERQGHLVVSQSYFPPLPGSRSVAACMPGVIACMSSWVRRNLCWREWKRSRKGTGLGEGMLSACPTSLAR